MGGVTLYNTKAHNSGKSLFFLALCIESFKLLFQYTDANLYFPFLISYTVAEFFEK